MALKFGMPHWQSMVLTVLIFVQPFNVLSIHAGLEPAIGPALWRHSSLAIGTLPFNVVTIMAFDLPLVNALSETQSLTREAQRICIALVSTPFIALELEKWPMKW